MQTFPDYDAEIAKVENLGLAGPGMALKKRANWTSFIKVRRLVVTFTCHKVSSKQARQPGSTRSVTFLLSPLLNALSKLSHGTNGRCLASYTRCCVSMLKLAALTCLLWKAPILSIGSILLVSELGCLARTVNNP